VENICDGCGLCCDGTLYSRVDIRSGDSIAFLERAGLRVVIGTDPMQSTFRQPCAASAAGRCTIYADRPIACRAYRCHLRRDYDVGSVSVEEARARIATATALRDQLRVRLQPLVGNAEQIPWHLLSKLAVERLERSEGDSRPPEYARVLLDIGALSMFLTRHFRVSPAQPSADGGSEEPFATDRGGTK
jgi:uncharacterized protein